MVQWREYNVDPKKRGMIAAGLERAMMGRGERDAAPVAWRARPAGRPTRALVALRRRRLRGLLPHRRLTAEVIRVALGVVGGLLSR